MNTNNLVYTIHTHDTDQNRMDIHIRLNDECNNGHQDFAITAEIYGKGRGRKSIVACGCLHDEILAVRPDLKIFVDLHLCDYKGIPMYAVENGFYNLKHGFNNKNLDAPSFKDTFCSYYRVSPEQFDILNACQNEIQYAIQLEKLGILTQWEKQANEAITLLEEMTGNKFIADSTKTQYHAPTPEQIEEEEHKQATGYYTTEAAEKRENQKKAKLRLKILQEQDEKLSQIETEYNIKLQVFDIGGKAALENFIYYNHTKQIAFNWKDYDKISDELVAKLKAEIILPDGVTFE